MSTKVKKATTKERHRRIREAYLRWAKEKSKKGVRLYTDEYIISELSDKFLLSERYIDDIINHRV